MTDHEKSINMVSQGVEKAKIGDITRMDDSTIRARGSKMMERK